MILNSLSKIASGKKKRVGRGYGSGKGGHTTSRGGKGKKSRGKIGLTFSGTKIKKSWLKRLPFKRGKGRLKKQLSYTISLSMLEENFKKDGVVTMASLIKAGLVKKGARVKIVDKGEIKKPLIIGIACSKSAEKKIKKVGGEIK